MPKLVDHRRASGDQAITDPVVALQVQLIIGLNRDKPHVLPLDCLGDRLRVDKVVLVRLYKGLHKLTYDQADIVAMLPQCASKKMRSGTGLQSDQRYLHLRGEGEELFPSELFPREHLAGRAECRTARLKKDLRICAVPIIRVASYKREILQYEVK
jgi:hypothetical protein